MPRNKITLTVAIIDDSYLPSREHVAAWLDAKYSRALEAAGQQRDGTAVVYKAEMPCPEIPRD